MLYAENKTKILRLMSAHFNNSINPFALWDKLKGAICNIFCPLEVASGLFKTKAQLDDAKFERGILGHVVFTSQPVEKNRDRTREEIMFMDAIINVTVVWSRAGPSVVGAERGRWSDCATHASRAAELLLCHSHRRCFPFSGHEYEVTHLCFSY